MRKSSVSKNTAFDLRFGTVLTNFFSEFEQLFDDKMVLILAKNGQRPAQTLIFGLEWQNEGNEGQN